MSSPRRARVRVPRRLTLAQYQAEVAANAAHPHYQAVVCVMCGTIQSPESFRRAGATAEQAGRAFGYSCVGRFAGAGGFDPKRKRQNPAGDGCDWTLGGLFTFREVEVTIENGRVIPAFRPATEAEAALLFAVHSSTPVTEDQWQRSVDGGWT